MCLVAPPRHEWQKGSIVATPQNHSLCPVGASKLPLRITNRSQTPLKRKTPFHYHRTRKYYITNSKPIPCPSFPCFWQKKGKKHPKRQGFALSTEPQSPWKRRENTQKTTNSLQRKNKEFQKSKERKDRVL